MSYCIFVSILIRITTYTILKSCAGKKIEYAFHKTTKPDILVLKEKVNSNEFINYLLMRFYNCERVIKYHFIKHLKDAIHDIVAFEMSIGDSRIDICRNKRKALRL